MELLTGGLLLLRRPFRRSDTGSGPEEGIMTRQPILLGVLVLAIGGASASEGAIGPGTISGRTLAHGEPAAVKMNLHKQPNGQFFGSATSDESGRFTFEGLPLGEYTLITWPVKEMPLQWSSMGSVELTSDRPTVEVPTLDCYSVRPLRPLDATRIEPDAISADSPLVFEWTPYHGSAEYVVEISSLDGKQRFVTPRLRETRFEFDGVLDDGSRLGEGLYRWVLTVYPEGGFWQGRSKSFDIAAGDLAELVPLDVGDHMKLTVPKWYLPTVEMLQLTYALDAAYEIEAELSGARPFGGERCGITYDADITFAHSGNPIHIGKPMWKERDFAWDIALHEMGHDFQTGSLPNLCKTICAGPDREAPFYQAFTEGLATLAGFYVAAKIEAKLPSRIGIGMPEETARGLIADIDAVKQTARDALAAYEELGCPRDRLTPDILDGFFLRLADDFGWQIFPSFFRAFAARPETTRVFESVDSDLKRQSIVVCAFSLACGTDLRERFEHLGIEVDEAFYQEVKDPLQIAIFGDRP
jgi:hypothetical protein